MTDSGEDLRQEALGRLQEFAANILRVMRGAGKPYDVVTDAMQLGIAMIEAVRDGGRPISDAEIIEALFVCKYEGSPSFPPNDVVRGALQVAASRLVGQRTQEAAGRTEIHNGLQLWEGVRQEQRKALR